MSEQLWTVVRFPNGSWSTGGKPSDPEYAECEVWRIPAAGRWEATKKAQSKRNYEQRKAKKAAACTPVSSVAGR